MGGGQSLKRDSSAQAATAQPREVSPTAHLPKFSQVLAVLYVALVPFESGLVVLGRSATFWVGLSVVGACVLSFLTSTRRRGSVALNASVIVPALALVAYVAASNWWSIDPDATYVATLGLASTVVMWIAVAASLAGCLRWGMWGLVVGSSVQAVQAFGAERNLDDRAEMVGDANDVATLLVVSAAFLTAEATSSASSWRIRIPALGLLALNVSGALATGSRTGVVALAVAVAALLINDLVRLKLNRVILMACGAAVATGVVMWMAIDIPERISGTGQSLESGSLSFREVLWSQAFEHIPSLGGIGFGATPALMSAEVGSPFVAHSVYIGTLLELGVVGAGLWLWFLFRLARGTWGHTLARHLLACSVVVLVMASTLSLEGRRPLWIVLTFLAATCILEPSGRRKS